MIDSPILLLFNFYIIFSVILFIDCKIDFVQILQERDKKTPAFTHQNRFIGGFPVAPHIGKDGTGQNKVLLYHEQMVVIQSIYLEYIDMKLIQ